MLFTTTLSLFVGLAASVPTSSSVSHGSFSLKQQPAGPRRHIALEMLRTSQKYSHISPVPDHIIKAAQAVGQQGTVPATEMNSLYDFGYNVPVKIGGQTFRLDLDTGSADLWVFSMFQPASQSAGHTLYKPGQSSMILLGYNWSISYGDGSAANGLVFLDTVSIGGVTYPQQAVGAALTVSSGFVAEKSDGILGLSLSIQNTIQPIPQLTFFDNVAPSLNAKLFTANLKWHATGTYEFGAINPEKYTGPITYYNNTSAGETLGLWTVTITGYSTGNAATTTAFQGAPAFIDTGTSLMYLDRHIVFNYYAQVPGAFVNGYSYYFACNTVLPTLQLSFGAFTAKIPGKFMNYGPAPDIGANVCVGSLQFVNEIPVLGDAFLKAVFVVFDQTYATRRIGFATAVL